jgi:hypothetical protein
VSAFPRILLTAALAQLGGYLALLTAAGRAYLRGEIEDAGRRSRSLAIPTLIVSLVALWSGSRLVDDAPRPGLWLASLALVAVSALSAFLGALSRKPVPSVWVAWAAFAAAVASAAAAVVTGS